MKATGHSTPLSAASSQEKPTSFLSPYPPHLFRNVVKDTTTYIIIFLPTDVAIYIVFTTLAANQLNFICDNATSVCKYA